jgi:multiple sugar transport system ATP-binding protein
MPSSQPVQDRPVVLGVRPEALTLLGADDPQVALRATVSLVEPMGADQVVWLDAQGVSLAAHLDAAALLDEGSRVGVGVDAGTVSLFDPESQQRL